MIYPLIFFGDLLIHNSVYQAAKTKDGYDFTNHFVDIQDKVKNADFTVGNLEVPTAGAKIGYSNYPACNCPEQILDAMRDVLDVDLITNATNHSLDKGYKGLTNTIDYLDKANLNHIGTYKDKASSDEIFIKTFDKGIKIAFLNYTYGTNGTNGIPMPKEHPYAINIIDKEKIVSDSDTAKRLGADFIIAKLHLGTEYAANESKEQQNLSRYLFENSDINLIVGDHPHVVQNIENIIVDRNGSQKVGTVVYSLGNFMSAQLDTLRNSGIICKTNLHINKSNPIETKVVSIEYTPVYVDRNPGVATKKYELLMLIKLLMTTKINLIL